MNSLSCLATFSGTSGCWEYAEMSPLTPEDVKPEGTLSASIYGQIETHARRVLLRAMKDAGNLTVENELGTG